MAYTVISKPGCAFCVRAKALLDSKGLAYKEQIVGTDITLEKLLELVPDAKTVPQIWDGEKYIGGYVQLEAHLNGIQTP